MDVCVFASPPLRGAGDVAKPKTSRKPQPRSMAGVRVRYTSLCFQTARLSSDCAVPAAGLPGCCVSLRARLRPRSPVAAPTGSPDALFGGRALASCATGLHCGRSSWHARLSPEPLHLVPAFIFMQPGSPVDLDVAPLKIFLLWRAAIFFLFFDLVPQQQSRQTPSPTGHPTHRIEPATPRLGLGLITGGAGRPARFWFWL